MEQEIFISNFENFLRFIYQEDFTTYFNLIADESNYTTSSKSFDNYYFCCFLKDNYDNSRVDDNQINKYHYVDCSKKEMLKRFRSDLKQFKRGLGLYLEYKLVQKFKLQKNVNKSSTGEKAWDFKIDNQKIDLKICFLREYHRANNESIYNRSYVIDRAEIVDVLESIVENDSEVQKRVDEMLQKMKKSLEIRTF
jgi:hypothetical protein